MFQAKRLIYKRLFERLRDQFDLKVNPTDGLFKTVQAGFHVRAANAFDSILCPWAFIEQGSSPGIDFFQSPKEWQYEVTYPMVIMTHADKTVQTGLVYNLDIDDDTVLHNENLGVEDLMDKVVDYFFSNFTNHRFDLFDDPAEQRTSDFHVEQWKVSHGIPTIPFLQPILMDAFYRAIQINFTFLVIEREDL